MSESVPRCVLLAGLTVLAVTFGVAYHAGAVNQEKVAAVPMESIRKRNLLMQAEAEKCETRRNNLFKSGAKDSTNSGYSDLKSADAEHKKLVRQEAAEDDKMSGCRASLVQLDSELEHAKGQVFTRVRALAVLNKQLNDLSNGINRLRKGMGMQRALLLDALHTERLKHYKLKRQLGDPIYGDHASYEQDLIATYASQKQSLNKTVEDIVVEVKKSADYSEPSVDEFLAQWADFNYDPNDHPDVFIPKNDGPLDKALPRRPKFFNREPAEETLGISFDKKIVPIRTTAFQMKALTTIGLCALRHNNTELTFPVRFRRVEDNSAVNFLNESLETPLVTYCRTCTSAINSTMFAIACGRETSNKLYGTYDFWTARSLLRPTSAVIEASRAIWKQLELGSKNVLGVAFKNPPQLKKKCIAARKPGRHYLWARALTQNSTLFHAVKGADREEQCQPTIGTLTDAVEALRQKEKFDVILVTVTSKEVEDQVKALDFGGAAQVVVMRPTTAFEDVVDITTLSWANHILVNRYSDHSQVLTEAFALRNSVTVGTETGSKIHFF
jgi:protein tyrosine phosphatase (PTP) superfamily phosphohydrolase (DUF442 family)